MSLSFNVFNNPTIIRIGHKQMQCLSCRNIPPWMIGDYANQRRYRWMKLTIGDLIDVFFFTIDWFLSFLTVLCRTGTRQSGHLHNIDGRRAADVPALPSGAANPRHVTRCLRRTWRLYESTSPSTTFLLFVFISIFIFSLDKYNCNLEHC